MKFTFLQNYNYGQLLTIGHDYPVPVDNHTVIKILPHPLTPSVGVKGQIFKFRNNSVSRQYFLLKFRMQTEEQ